MTPPTYPRTLYLWASGAATRGGRVLAAAEIPDRLLHLVVVEDHNQQNALTGCQDEQLRSHGRLRGEVEFAGRSEPARGVTVRSGRWDCQ